MIGRFGNAAGRWRHPKIRCRSAFNGESLSLYALDMQYANLQHRGFSRL